MFSNSIIRPPQLVNSQQGNFDKALFVREPCRHDIDYGQYLPPPNQYNRGAKSPHVLAQLLETQLYRTTGRIRVFCLSRGGDCFGSNPKQIAGQQPGPLLVRAPRPHPPQREAARLPPPAEGGRRGVHTAEMDNAPVWRPQGAPSDTRRTRPALRPRLPDRT